jgi:DNA transposition AAA+ family ATPase
MGRNKLQTVGQSPLWDEDLRAWFENYLQEHPHHSTAVLSRAQYIGVSRAVLDDYVAGKYFLPVESGGRGVKPENSKLESAVRAYRERIEGSVRHGYTNTFVETRTWFQLQRACHVAMNENVMVVVYGKPGVGKSRCLLEFVVKKMSTAPLTFLCSRNVTPIYFVEKLAEELGLKASGKIAKSEDLIAEKLNRYPRPIFVDQANYLTERSLGSVCYIWERARVPIVLVGTKDLYVLFTTSNRTEDVRAQISSRVAMHYLLSELSLPDVKAIIKRALGDDATDEVVAKIFNVTGGIHRHVDMIVPRILDLKARNKEKLAAGKVTMGDIITTAGARLMT